MTCVISPEYYPSPSPFPRLFSNLPDELIRYIVEYDPKIINTLYQTSKPLSNVIHDVADEYALKKRVSTLTPYNATSITTMMISMNPSLINAWGKYNSTVSKERLLCEAIRTGKIDDMLDLLRRGVDVDAVRSSSDLSKPVSEHANNVPYPIEEAAGYNRYDELKLLIEYGAILNPMCYISNRWFMDGYTDLLHNLSSTRFNIPVDERIPDLILDTYIKRGDLTPFTNSHWQFCATESYFNYICKAVIKIPYGTKTNHHGWCGISECDAYCSNMRLCNGLVLCKECYKQGKNKEPLTLENIRERLRIDPIVHDDDETVDYNGQDDQHDDDEDDIESGDYPTEPYDTDNDEDDIESGDFLIEPYDTYTDEEDYNDMSIVDDFADVPVAEPSWFDDEDSFYPDEYYTL